MEDKHEEIYDDVSDINDDIEEIDESLKYPTKAHARKTTDHARKRGNPVLGESAFETELEEALASGDICELIDEESGKILYSEILDEEELTRRNKLLVESEEPYRWHNG